MIITAIITVGRGYRKLSLLLHGIGVVVATVAWLVPHSSTCSHGSLMPPQTKGVRDYAWLACQGSRNRGQGAAVLLNFMRAAVIPPNIFATNCYAAASVSLYVAAYSHQNKIVALNLQGIAKEFVLNNEARIGCFGHCKLSLLFDCIMFFSDCFHFLTQKLNLCSFSNFFLNNKH